MRRPSSSSATGDVAMEYIVHSYSQATGEGEASYHKTPEDILRLFDHEHDPGAFVEKRSGLSFLSRAVSGINIGGEPQRGEYGT